MNITHKRVWGQGSTIDTDSWHPKKLLHHWKEQILCTKGWLRAGKGEMSLKHTALPENKEVFEQLLGDAWKAQTPDRRESWGQNPDNLITETMAVKSYNCRLRIHETSQAYDFWGTDRGFFLRLDVSCWIIKQTSFGSHLFHLGKLHWCKSTWWVDRKQDVQQL